MEKGDPSTTAAVIVSPEKFYITKGTNEKTVVQITNISFESVLFRILSTNPERFIVKPSKGVVKPYASVTVSIILVRDYVPKDGVSNAKREDFRIQYCLVGPDDVIERHNSNVGDLIKARKQASNNSVHVKTFRCLINTPDENKKADSVESSSSRAPTAATDRPSGARSGSEPMGVSLSSINPRELEQSTLAARKKRQLDQQQKNKTRFLILMALLVVIFAIWLVSF